MSLRPDLHPPALKELGNPPPPPKKNKIKKPDNLFSNMQHYMGCNILHLVLNSQCCDTSSLYMMYNIHIWYPSIYTWYVWVWMRWKIKARDTHKTGICYLYHLYLEEGNKVIHGFKNVIWRWWLYFVLVRWMNPNL